MTQIEQVNEQILAAIKKNDPFFEALWGKEEFIPNSVINNINDFNCGAIANSLEYVSKYIEEITESNLLVLDEPYIDIIVYFMTGIKRFVGESNEDIVNRMRSLLERLGEWQADKWGTPWDILNVLSYYLSRNFLFYIPNKIHTDLIINGDFEQEIGSEWVLTGGSKTTGDAFVGSYKLDFSTITSASQIVSVTQGTYLVHSFIKPVNTITENTPLMQLDLKRSSDNYYYNISTKSWGISNPNNVFSGDKNDYQLLEEYILVDGSYDIEIKFVQIEDVFLDYVQFGKKEYPYWEIIYIDKGNVSGFASLWETGVTPYDNASFLDQDFLLESLTSVFSDSFYQRMVDILRAAGVRAKFTREVRL